MTGLFVYLGFNVAFNTVQVISRRAQVTGEPILTYSGHSGVMDTGEWRTHTYLKWTQWSAGYRRVESSYLLEVATVG